ncbi:MAG: hypothetical protein CMJ83_22320 [Planctomycetes bacterium]|nr:hypothetical protein [Planctomycetota bacterium]
MRDGSPLFVPPPLEELERLLPSVGVACGGRLRCTMLPQRWRIGPPLAAAAAAAALFGLLHRLERPGLSALPILEH